MTSNHQINPRLLRLFSCFALSGFILSVLGCAAVGPNYQAPSTVLPDSWNQSLSKDLHSSNPSLEAWWTRFNDPTLNRLIEVATRSNKDLAIAYERVTEARAARQSARSQLFPSLDLNGGVSRGRTSESLGSPSPPAGNTTNFWVSGLDAGWEADVFGGVRRTIEAADASTAATEEAYRDTLVSLLAEVSLNYIQIRTFDERIRLAQENIRNQQDSVKLTSDRLEAGLSPQIDVSQAKSNLATTTAVIPSLRNQRTIALNRLATLLGRYPAGTQSLLGTSKGIPKPAKSAGVGIPANLIRSRPDIRSAERALAYQNALVGVAEAELYPRFFLSGTFQLQSTTATDFVDLASRDYSFGPNFRWNLFSGGRVKSQIAIEESRTKQAYLTYEKTVLLAVEEVENALSSVTNERQRMTALNEAVSASATTVSLVKDNYREGLIDFQNVLDAERTIFANQDEAAISQGQIAAAYVSLYKALGGGTEMRAGK